MTVASTERLDIKLTNADLFAQLLTHHGYSVRSFTEAVQLKLIRQRVHTKVSRSTIGHLRSGRRRTCNPDVGNAIAALLGMPVSALFTPTINPVTRDTPPTSKGRTANV